MLSHNDQGISLIEVIIAVMVLSIGSIAAIQSLSQARKGIGEELPRYLAQQIAINQAEELKTLAGVAPIIDTVEMGNIKWDVEAERKATAAGLVEVTIRVSAPGHPGALLVTYVTTGAAR